MAEEELVLPGAPDFLLEAREELEQRFGKERAREIVLRLYEYMGVNAIGDLKSYLEEDLDDALAAPIVSTLSGFVVELSEGLAAKASEKEQEAVKLLVACALILELSDEGRAKLRRLLPA